MACVTLDDWLSSVSDFTLNAPSLSARQTALHCSLYPHVLGRVLSNELRQRLPRLKSIDVGDRMIKGALGTVNVDVSELHPTDGLRLAVEIKPVNLAVGRAIWNRFGDIRTFAVNLHLKFPFAVVGGVLAIPTFEWSGGRPIDPENPDSDLGVSGGNDAALTRRPTTGLVKKAISRLVRAGGRRTEGDAPHLLEAIAVVVYDPDTQTLSDTLPPKGSRLRWDEFIEDLAQAYEARFE